MSEFRSRDIVAEVIEIPKEITSTELTTVAGEKISIYPTSGFVVIEHAKQNVRFPALLKS